MPVSFGRQGRISGTFAGRVGDSCSEGTGTEYAPAGSSLPVELAAFRDLAGRIACLRIIKSDFKKLR